MPVCLIPGGHDNFRKMIDEAEPLGYPVVVKNARGHRGECRTCSSAFISVSANVLSVGLAILLTFQMHTSEIRKTKEHAGKIA